MAIIFHKFPAPSLTATLSAGGDLSANTTYYIVGCFAKGYGGPRAQVIYSPASNQVSFTTTDENRSVFLEWTPSVTSISADSIYGYNYTAFTYRWDANPIEISPPELYVADSPGWIGQWYSTYWTVGNLRGSNVLITSNTSFPKGVDYIGYGQHPQLASYSLPTSATTANVYNYLSVTSGVLGIELTDSVTIAEVINALTSTNEYNDYYIYRKNHLTLMGMMFGNATLTSSNISFTFVSSHPALPNAYWDNCSLYFTNRNAGDRYSYEFSGNYNDTKIFASDHYFAFTTSLTTNNLYYTDAGRCILYGSLSGIKFNGVDYSDYNSRYPCVNYRYPTSSMLLKDCDFKRFTLMPTKEGPGYFYCKNLNFYNEGIKNEDIRIWDGSWGTLTALRIGKMTNCTSNRSDGLIKVRYEWYTGSSTAYSEIMPYEFWYEQKYKIINIGGEPLSDVNLTLINNLGQLSATGISDINGEINFEVKTYDVQFNSLCSNNDYYAEYIHHTPFTITLAKTGYKTQTGLISITSQSYNYFIMKQGSNIENVAFFNGLIGV